MPHQCVRCGKLYEDGSAELLKGCSCGGKFFFFMKKVDIETKEIATKLTKDEKEQIERDVFDLIGDNIDRSKPVVLDLESVKIVKPGKFEIDLIELFKGKPLVYKLEDGKYMIDLASSFKKPPKK